MSGVNGPSSSRPASPGAAPANEPLDLRPPPQREVNETAARDDAFASGAGRTARVALEAAPPDLAQKALDSFHARVGALYTPSAAALAKGARPIGPGDELTPEQLSQVKAAAVDLLQDLPVSALPDAVANEIRDLLGPKGASIDFNQTSLRQLKGLLGDRAKDVAKEWVDALKAKSPATFYGVAAGAAVALGYTQGSEGLNRLGIKPEYKMDLSKHVDLEVAAQFDKGFRNFGAKVGVSAHGQIGDAKLAGSVRYDTLTGSTVAAGSISLTRPDFSLSASANYDFSSGAGSASVTGKYQVTPNLNLSAGVHHDFATGSTRGELGATYTRGNLDFSLSASASDKDARVGAGLTWRF